MSPERWVRDLMEMQAEAILLSPRVTWVGPMSHWDLYLQYLARDQSRPGYPEGAD